MSELHYPKAMEIAMANATRERTKGEQQMGRTSYIEQRMEAELAEAMYNKAVNDANHFERLYKSADEAHTYMVGQNNKLRRTLDQAFPQCYDAVIAALSLSPADTAKVEAAIIKVQQNLTGGV